MKNTLLFLYSFKGYIEKLKTLAKAHRREEFIEVYKNFKKDKFNSYMSYNRYFRDLSFLYLIYCFIPFK